MKLKLICKTLYKKFQDPLYYEHSIMFSSYKRYKTRLLLRFLVQKKKALVVMDEVHKGLYGDHKSKIKIKWLIMNNDYCWPGITKDCLNCAKGCQTCQ
jgi:hypothetical protein